MSRTGITVVAAFVALLAPAIASAQKGWAKGHGRVVVQVPVPAPVVVVPAPSPPVVYVPPVVTVAPPAIMVPLAPPPMRVEARPRQPAGEAVWSDRYA